MSVDPGFDAFVDAVERACHRYRHAAAQMVDPLLAKAQLIAVCDVMAHQPACKPEPDPMPDGLVDRTLAEIREHIAQRRTPELCDCSCHSGATAGGHTPICWLRWHTIEGMTHV